MEKYSSSLVNKECKLKQTGITFYQSNQPKKKAFANTIVAEMKLVGAFQSDDTV